MNKFSILVADDDPRMLEVLENRCRQHGLEVLTAADAMTALSTIDFCQPDIVCLDIDMPCGNGLSVCEMMASDDRLTEIPVIILTGKSDLATQKRCRDMRAHHLCKRANLWPQLAALIDKLLPSQDQPASTQPASTAITASQVADPAEVVEAKSTFEGPAATGPARPCETTSGSGSSAPFALNPFSKFYPGPPPARLPMPQQTPAERKLVNEWLGDQPQPELPPKINSEQPPQVLHIEDDDQLAETLKIRLEAHGVAVIRARQGMEGFRHAFRYPIDAVILDVELPDGNGDYILRRLRDNPITEQIPVIVVSGRRDRHIERTMDALGASAFLHKPVTFERLRVELRKHVDILDRAPSLAEVR